MPPPSERTIGSIHQIIQIQQARFRHTRAVEGGEDEYTAKHCYMPNVETEMESFGLKAVGVEEVVGTQAGIRQGLGPHRSLVNRFTVDLIDDTNANSVDEIFLYSTLNGSLISIMTNEISWVLCGEGWKIASIKTNQEWGI
eukprot:TRINITY_DN10708_c0_g1_i3.p1 TRINITY_DN10708_c0_g1~~TRINITY_DN10708_c0_g1_i3.p1  ORF type:complete len:141 (-),score=25.59 TRINITY_DN10708_c0_g1_i3:16-438(-)